MEIKKEEIKKACNLLKKVEFLPTKKSKAILFFPIEKNVKAEINNSLILIEEKEDYGSGKFLRAGIALEVEEGKVIPTLAYATIEYALKFNLKEFLKILNKNSEKEILDICSFDCVLVREEQILAEFRY